MTRGEAVIFWLLWAEALGALGIGLFSFKLGYWPVAQLAGVAVGALLVGILGVLRCSRPSR